MIRASIIIWLILTTGAHAETVSVKYHGDVSLDGFECPDIKSSSFVNRICYDAVNTHLIVQLRSTYYLYCNVPNVVVTEWTSAPSLGRHYNRNIKSNSNMGKFDCSK